MARLCRGPLRDAVGRMVPLCVFRTAEPVGPAMLDLVAGRLEGHGLVIVKGAVLDLPTTHAGQRGVAGLGETPASRTPS